MVVKVVVVEVAVVEVVVGEVVVGEVVVDEVVVVEVVVDEVVGVEVVEVVVGEVTTASVKVWVALPAPLAAFRLNLVVPGFSGEPTITATPSLLLIWRSEGKFGHCGQSGPLQPLPKLIFGVGMPLATTGNSKRL